MRIRKMFTLSVVFASLFLIQPTTDIGATPRSLKTKSFETLDKNTKRQIECLTDNIFFEAGAESHSGKIAVAFVTMNRAKSDLYPKDVCDVVKQKIGKTCQFSWVCSKKTTSKKVLTIEDFMMYTYLRSIAIDVFFHHEKLLDPSRGALFYHADYVKPNWKMPIKKTTKIGKHIFYKMKETNT